MRRSCQKVLRFALGAILAATAHGLARAQSNTNDPNAIPPLRPMRPEIGPTFWEVHGWTVSIGSILLILLAAIIVWFLTRRKPPVPVPPGVRIRKRLQQLRSQKPDDRTLSEITRELRLHVLEVLELPMSELTTAEFSETVSSRLSNSLAPRLVAFLREADQQKFAGRPNASANCADEALQIVEAIEAHLASSQPGRRVSS
jgi:hypothetical protein